MKVLTFSFEPESNKEVKITCTFGQLEVSKRIPIASKPIRFTAVFNDKNELADIEVVFIE